MKARRERREDLAERGMMEERRKQRLKNDHLGKEAVEKKGTWKGALVGEEAGMGPANQLNVTLTSVANEGDLIDTKSLLCPL